MTSTILVLTWIAGAIVVGLRLRRIDVVSPDDPWFVLAFVVIATVAWPLAVPAMWLFVRAFSDETGR